MNYRKDLRLVKRGKQIAVLACIFILALVGSVWNAAGMQRVLKKSTQEYCSSIIEQIASVINDGV